MKVTIFTTAQVVHIIARITFTHVFIRSSNIRLSYLHLPLNRCLGLQAHSLGILVIKTTYGMTDYHDNAPKNVMNQLEEPLVTSVGCLRIVSDVINC